MKKITFALAGFCFFLVSCNNSSDTATTTTGATDSTAEKYKQINRDVLKGIETGDATKFGGIADDAVDHAGPMGDVKGGDSIKHFLADMHNHVSNLKIDIHGEAVDGDYLYVWSTMSGTAKDNAMMMSPGKSFSWKGVDVLKFSNGKAVEHWGYMDPRDMMAMGPQPGAKDTTKKK